MLMATKFHKIYIFKISSKIWLVGINRKATLKKNNYMFIIFFLILSVSTVLPPVVLTLLINRNDKINP